MTVAWISLIVLAVDQTSKYLVNGFFMRHEPSVPIIANFFHLTLVHNTGVAFGLFRNHQKLLLVVILISLGALLIYLTLSREKRFWMQAAYGMILGGAMGNLIDRIRWGWVLDFLDFRVWPVFNLADTFISIGVGILLLEMIISNRHSSGHKRDSSSGPTGVTR